MKEEGGPGVRRRVKGELVMGNSKMKTMGINGMPRRALKL
jgi:hypothetical protein